MLLAIECINPVGLSERQWEDEEAGKKEIAAEKCLIWSPHLRAIEEQ